jgi:predicted N-acetyltransferase YhbS
VFGGYHVLHFSAAFRAIYHFFILFCVFYSKTLLGKILVFAYNSTIFGVKSLALAPISILSAYQRRNIGSELIRKGLEKAKKLDFPEEFGV